jgi:hypothetical protein
MLMELNNLISWPALLISLFVFAVFFRDIWGGGPAREASDFDDEDEIEPASFYDPATAGLDVGNMAKR